MRRRGTSLVEMLIVLTLLGIITSIAAPKLRPSAKGTVEQTARLMAQDLDLARTRAFATRSLTRVVVQDTIWQSFLDNNRDTVIVESATERTAFGALNSRRMTERVMLGRGVASRLPTDTVSATPPAVRRIQFGARGTTEPFGTSTVLYLTYNADSTAVSAVEINPAANVRVWRWVDGTWQ